ncbi:acetylornithine transaminase [Enterococcus sp. AZ192]|uniref:acetylornithine transaminase n=1 Tax=unclassified Enterococcus TaxID=2608891 RepID=UPI003D290E2A
MSYLFPNYQRKKIQWVKGINNTLIDQDGKSYLDFTSGIGVMNLGYGDSSLNEVLSDQAANLWHAPNLYESKFQEETAEKLANGRDYVAYFCNSGAEANEAAIKLARKATGRSKIISFVNSFHGRTYGAMSATGQESIHQGFQPLVPDFDYLPFNDLDSLKQKIDKQTAAVILELIQGEGGVIPAKQEWVKQIEQLCRTTGTLLIIDEIQTGIGRTGSLYAYEQYEIEPDIFTLAKGLGNGIPVGAMLGKKSLAQAFGSGSHGSTFGGNNLAMRVASEVIERINQPDFLLEVQRKGNLLIKGLNQLALKTTLIKDVRGKGLMAGIELTDADVLASIMEQLKEEGLITLKAGQAVLRLLPPLTISDEELNRGVELLEKVLCKEQKND